MQGDVIAIVDKDAKTVAEYSYDAWGVCTVVQNYAAIATINPFRYRGYYYDEEIELYYLQSRYYDASVGRFINSDAAEFLVNEENSPILNGFSYCENNPVIHRDSFGNESEYIDSDTKDINDAKDKKMSIVNYVKALKKTGATPLFFVSVNGKKDGGSFVEK